jgi:hypothetical protein
MFILNRVMWLCIVKTVTPKTHNRGKSEIMDCLKLWIVWNYGLSGIVDFSHYWY